MPMSARLALAGLSVAAWTTAAPAQTPAVPADPPPAAGATAALTGDATARGPLGRFFDAYRPTPSDPAAPEPARRAPPAPFASPPFPFGEYIGPAIGVPDTTADYPLMRALTGTSVGDFLGLSKTRIYGWADAGASFSTSNRSNFPLSYTIQPNQLVLNQLVIRAERAVDTVQQDHWDWGYRLSNVYGVDPRFTVAKGLASDPLLKRNQEYLYDPVEAYGQVYIPGVAEGMLVWVGRYISPTDIEAQLSPDNYLYSHSLMFTFDPYTFTGTRCGDGEAPVGLIASRDQAGLITRVADASVAAQDIHAVV